ncbi:hypothetical protein HPB50_004583 [Hyalomma asiaticum]|uniref:Uncharacterized protein n=1 Tax=Hyalomma asiaticum TaxID=266040 RepID=A0ACB7TC30_HYAAI|nr:hypothetical protein HPB50_004583 [Hyalomma asiaticum]
MNDGSLLQETSCDDSGTVEEIIWNMENGGTVPEEDAVICTTEPLSPVQDDSSEGSTQATLQVPPPTKENSKKKSKRLSKLS